MVNIFIASARSETLIHDLRQLPDVNGDLKTRFYSARSAMFERLDPYFRAAMHHAFMEAECREFAARLKGRLDRESAGEGADDHREEQGLSEPLPSVSRLDLELEFLRRERAEAEKHARMRRQMERYL